MYAVHHRYSTQIDVQADTAKEKLLKVYTCLQGRHEKPLLAEQQHTQNYAKNTLSRGRDQFLFWLSTLADIVLCRATRSRCCLRSAAAAGERSGRLPWPLAGAVSADAAEASAAVEAVASTPAGTPASSWY